MSTVIRLARFGKRHNSVYRAVVIDNRKARNDSFIEQVGFYDPNHKQPVITFEQEKVLKWLQTGAQPSDTVASLLKKQWQSIGAIHLHSTMGKSHRIY